MKTLAVLVLFSFSLLFNPVCGQESIGVGVSNYAPANSLLLNPSSIVDSKAFIDVHLIGVSAFAFNNLVYFSGDEVSLRDPSSFNGASIYTSDRGPFRAYTDVLVQGPTITATVGKHSIGIYSGVRAMVDVRGLGSKTADYIMNGFQYGPYIGTETRVRDLRVTSLVWGEIGLSYGTILKQRGREMITAGIHVKRLIGIAGAAARLNEWHFIVEDSSMMRTHSISGSYGFNEPALNTGRGWGVDIGFTYKRTLSGVDSYIPHLKAGGCETCDYQYKVSVALLDLGRVNFDPIFYTGVFNEGDSLAWENFAEESPSDAASVSDYLDDRFRLGDMNNKEKFRVGLPAALSVQVDYNLGYHFYVNGSLVLGMPYKQNFGIQRAALLSLTPRYEIKRFEAALPFSFHELRHPMIGAMLRLNSIIVGTDNLGAWLFNSDVRGADIYFHVKYTIFRAPGCKERVRAKRRADGGRTVPCASW